MPSGIFQVKEVGYVRVHLFKVWRTKLFSSQAFHSKKSWMSLLPVFTSSGKPTGAWYCPNSRKW